MSKIRVTRGLVVERENGDVLVSVTIGRADRDAFFRVAGAPGAVLLLGPDDSSTDASPPPPQSVRASGVPDGSIGAASSASSRDARDAALLCNNPWFQQFALHRLGTAVSPDAVVNARAFVAQEVLSAGAWTDASSVRYKSLLEEYAAWCRGKGYGNG